MKIDFELLDKMVEAGATAAVLVAYLKDQHLKNEKQREADRIRKTPGKPRNSSEIQGIPEVSSGIPGNSDDFQRKKVEAKKERAWQQACQTWQQFRRWPKELLPDPESPACRCPPEMLAKYDIKIPEHGPAQ